MAEPNKLIDDFMAALAASTIVGAAIYGLIGGLTSALAIKVERKMVLRQVALGILVAVGMGAGAGPFIDAWVGGELGEAVAGASSSLITYLTAVFGPAIFEVILGRIRAGRRWNEPGTPGDGEGAE